MKTRKNKLSIVSYSILVLLVSINLISCNKNKDTESNASTANANTDESFFGLRASSTNSNDTTTSNTPKTFTVYAITDGTDSRMAGDPNEDNNTKIDLAKSFKLLFKPATASQGPIDATAKLTRCRVHSGSSIYHTLRLNDGCRQEKGEESEGFGYFNLYPNSSSGAKMELYAYQQESNPEIYIASTVHLGQLSQELDNGKVIKYNLIKDSAGQKGYVFGYVLTDYFVIGKSASRQQKSGAEIETEALTANKGLTIANQNYTGYSFIPGCVGHENEYPNGSSRTFDAVQSGCRNQGEVLNDQVFSLRLNFPGLPAAFHSPSVKYPYSYYQLVTSEAKVRNNNFIMAIAFQKKKPG